jgi:hypothetical protein
MSEKPEAWTAIDSFVWPHIAANLIREQHADNERLRDELRQSSIDHTRAEVERLKAVALQAQNAAIDLAKENERLREALPYDWDQLEACRGSLREHMAEIKRLTADNERLREEVRVLRLYGNKDCTAMADEAMKEAALRREETT